ncbi:MAG TPA: hypothetical protein VMH04_09790 [Candidatus Solibacter sp.]|nr:hypothetical protein [Candidatus Solibacter sp.]
MKALSQLTHSKRTQSGVAFGVALALVLMIAPASSYATNSQQIARNLFITTTTAECCVLLGPTVKNTEPATPTNVIVTWSADYIVFDTVLFGLSVNGGACQLYGSGVANVGASGTQSSFVSGTFQWVVEPAELKKGVNTFTVCGGGVNKATTFSTGSNTLTVQGSN